MPATEHEDPNDELVGGVEEDVTSEGNSDQDMDDLIEKLMPAAAEPEAEEPPAEAPKPKKSKALAKPKAEAPNLKAEAPREPGEWFMGHCFPNGVPENTRAEMELGAARVQEAVIRDEARAKREAEEEAAASKEG